MRGRLAIFLIGFSVLLFLGCSDESKRGAQKQAPENAETPPEVITCDALFAGLIANGATMKEAQTTVAKEELLKLLNSEACRLLEGKHLEVVVSISNVRMLNDTVASLSISTLSLPSLADKKLGFTVAQGEPIDLPIGKAEALRIKPGQKLLLIGPAQFSTGNILVMSMPRSGVLARVLYTGTPLTLSVLTMSPKQYAFVN